MREPEELSYQECVDLLAVGLVGRIAVVTTEGLRIIPVNYALHQGVVLFRTSPGSELAMYGPDREAAFEIDHLDYERQRGWSVVAHGRLSLVDPAELAAMRTAWDPRPWAGGPRNLYLQLRWHSVSGRRIGRDWTRATMTPVRRWIS